MPHNEPTYNVILRLGGYASWGGRAVLGAQQYVHERSQPRRMLQKVDFGLLHERLLRLRPGGLITPATAATAATTTSTAASSASSAAPTASEPVAAAAAVAAAFPAAAAAAATTSVGTSTLASLAAATTTSTLASVATSVAAARAACTPARSDAGGRHTPVLPPTAP